MDHSLNDYQLQGWVLGLMGQKIDVLMDKINIKKFTQWMGEIGQR